MRILFICGYYPPLELGGWDQLTQEIVRGLVARGHDCRVLTSRYRIRELHATEAGIERRLHLESADLNYYHPLASLTRGCQEAENGRFVRQVIRAFQPDVLFVHSMWNVPRSTAWHAEQALPGRVVYYIASDWPYKPSAHQAYWQSTTRRAWMRPVKKTVSWLPLYLERKKRQKQVLCFERVLCVSETMRQDMVQYVGIPPERMQVIYNGVDTEQFAPPEGWQPETWRNNRPALLYAGGLVWAKGVHTAIEGFARIANQPEFVGSSLTIVGSGHPDYVAGLHQLVRKNGLGERVHFQEWVNRSQMPELLKRFDILLMPSHGEALSRVMQEAMACGLVVLGTTTGGSKELLVEDESGLSFDPEDAEGLARQLERISQDRELRVRLAIRGRDLVKEKFGIDRMINEIEIYFTGIMLGPGK